MLGIPKPTGNWFVRQWHLLTELGSTQVVTMLFALGTIVCILAFKRWLPVVPGAIVAVVLAIVLSSALHLSEHGVAVVGQVAGGFPPIGSATGRRVAGHPRAVSGPRFSCFVLIIAQSAATSP